MRLLKKHGLWGIFFFCFLGKSHAQFYTESNWGFKVGAVMAIGTKFQRVGLSLQTYYLYNFVQANAEVRSYVNFKNLGPKRKYAEFVTSGGIVFGYGPKQSCYNPFLSSVSNQTGYTYSFAYAYNAYWPCKIKTRQQTGTLALQFNNFSIISENDILGHTYYDRFRTGAFLLQYQYQNKYQFALNCSMWTGQMGNKITGDPNFPAGYMDTTNGAYTHYSHGLLSAQVKTYLDQGQNVQANIGLDAEQVRNFVQNKLIHDMIFIPRKWFKPKNAHIPMLDREGNQYLYKDGQQIKKTELYWNVFSNASLFY
ncbi:MAG TPA: polymorphic toxin type 23 domain-containing protein [Bacteroidia bacterium]|nr:polymorphic toxin type 23 domain-containing protein [Bacteroidia bacterium]